jgi:hypothetical protein
VLVGHVDPRRGWTVDGAFPTALTAGVDYVLNLTLQGTVVTPSLNGNVLGSIAYNSGVSDGKVGTLAKSGTTSFERFRIRSNDEAFIGVVQPPELRIADLVVTEGSAGNNVITLTLSLTRPVTAETTIGWRTIDGTALAGSDYVGVSAGIATFAAGSSSATIQVTLLGDGQFEPNEMFSIELTSWPGLNLADKTGVITITNDDLAPVVSIAATDAAGAEQGLNPIAFTVTRTTNLVGAINVGLAWGGSATAADYNVSLSAGASISGNVLTIPSGVGSVTVTITPVDDTSTEPAETVTLGLLAGTGYNLGGSTTASGSITDNDAPAVVSLAATDAAAAELNLNPLVFTLTRTVNANNQLVINLAWSGAATYGTDYTVSVTGGTLSANGLQLTLQAGVTTAVVTMTPVDDTTVELTENVTLTLASGTGYTVGTPSAATGNITDNDLPVLSVANASVTEGNNGTKTVAVTVTMSAPRSTAVTVAYATLAGTATAPSDYQGASATLTFAAGVISRTFNVTINGDRTNEANETFQVVLSNPSGATIGAGTATVTIVNDDNALTAAATIDQPVAAKPLTEADLGPIVFEAKRRLALAGLDADTVAKLDQVTVQIADLDGELLGMEHGDTVLIDRDAAGFGWFIDQTPGDDVEFVDGMLTASFGAPTGSMDLLTVVTHELGHAAGLDHDEPTDGESHDLMEAQLTPRERHLPPSFEISYVLSPVATLPQLKSVEMLASSIGQGLAELLLGDALVGELAFLLASGPPVGQTPISTEPNPWQDFVSMDNNAPIPQVLTSVFAPSASVRLRARPLEDSVWSNLIEPEPTDDVWWSNGDSD